jgi:hypothetical protein
MGRDRFPTTHLSAVLGVSSPDPQGRYYYFEIILPGSLVGAIVGYACYRFGRSPQQKAI